MNTHVDKTQENKSPSASENESGMLSGGKSTFQLVDNRPEAIAQRKLQAAINNSPKVQQMKAIQEAANNSPQVRRLAQLKAAANSGARPALEAKPIQAQKESDTPEFIPKHTDNEFTQKAQKEKIAASLAEAYKMVGRAKSKISKDNELYKTWMDAGNAPSNLFSRVYEWITDASSSRIAHVKKGFDKIEAVLEKETVHFKDYAINDGKKDTTYAYVYKKEKLHNIYLGGAFWNAVAKGYDSKPGTIIHELSHRVHGTDDHVYGQEKAKKLAINDPEKATTNADNYEYLAESTN